MHNYLLLARGQDLSTARVLAVSAEERIVNHFLEVLGDEYDADDHERELRLVRSGDDD